MTLHLGEVAASTTLYIPFGTYNSSGASSTVSNFVVGDIAIYKNGSTTQRTSTAGFTLLDTDGIDFDGVTGINGFSIDLSDNTDAGFYAVGSNYWVVVGPVTVDTQTVNFVAAVFRIRAAEDTTGYKVVTLKSTEGAVLADAFLNRDMSTGTDSGSTTVRTVRQALRFLRNKWSIAAGTMTVTKEDDTTTSWTAAVTGTAGADPITAVDPAGP